MTAPTTRPCTTQHIPEPVLAVRTRGPAKSYPGPGGTVTHAVRDLDLDVPRGETFAFPGPNGAGKSTTIALLCALARPTAGRATVAGADVLTQPHRVRRHVGMLFQHSAMDLELTADQNLYIHARLYGLGRRHARRRITEVLDAVCLADRRRSPVRTLSGGMRRRLEIARGLLRGCIALRAPGRAATGGVHWAGWQPPLLLEAALLLAGGALALLWAAHRFNRPE